MTQNLSIPQQGLAKIIYTVFLMIVCGCSAVETPRHRDLSFEYLLAI